ncbi:hypothetical protein [Natranaerovirga hydrolytica]|nr:hypothetical protein [Natranaerovirga hydrolytica]
MYEHDNKYIALTIILGVAGLVLWIVPLVGFWISLLCVILSVKSLDRKVTVVMKGTLVIGIVGAIISLINSIIIYFI